MNARLKMFRPGKIILTVVEINTFGEVEKEAVGNIEVDVGKLDEFQLVVDVDPFRTIYLIVSNPSTKEIHYYRVNNLFYGEEHSSSGKHFSSEFMADYVPQLGAQGFRSFPPKRINET